MAKQQRLKQPHAPAVARPKVAEAAVPIRLWHYLILFAVLLVVMLVFWRLLLLKPLLALSQSVVDGAFNVLVGNSPGGYVTVVNSRGDWMVHDALLTPQPQISEPLETLQSFSLCLPIFWALALAARPGRQAWRILGVGTGVMLIVSQVAPVMFLADRANAAFGIASAGWAVFLLRVAGYCAVAVAPSAAPLVLVMWLDRNLRAQVFPEPKSQKSPDPAA